MEVLGFKENKNVKYAITKDSVFEIDDEQIRALWLIYMTEHGVYREDDAEYTVFMFSEPVDFDKTVNKGKSKYKRMVKDYNKANGIV